MKKIIALYGISNSGKTSTLKKIYELIRYFCKEEIIQEINKEIFCILTTINGIKIGIVSQGDPSTGIDKKIEKFIEKGCSIIICATRTRGETVQVVQSYKKLEYEIEWVEAVSLTGYEKTKRDLYNHLYKSLIQARVEDIMDRVNSVLKKNNL